MISVKLIFAAFLLILIFRKRTAGISVWDIYNFNFHFLFQDEVKMTTREVDPNNSSLHDPTFSRLVFFVKNEDSNLIVISSSKLIYILIP
jgi:hypothetical protein